MQNTSKEYDAVVQVCQELFSKKMKDYGCAWRILRLPSLTDQIFIKAQRIRGLQQNAVQRVEEGAASEFIGYIQLADLKDITNPIHFKYQKSIIMATYMLCGFANFASIGIQIGGIGSLAPGQRKTLSELGIKALIGGTIASLLSATIAGGIIG